VKNLEAFFHVDVKVLISLGQKLPETKALFGTAQLRKIKLSFKTV
jgi:hypothetical protein